MDAIYKFVVESDDLFEALASLNTDDEWYDFLDEVAHVAAEDEQNSINLCSSFESFLAKHGYIERVSDIIFDAMKAFTNEQIIETKADFDLI